MIMLLYVCSVLLMLFGHLSKVRKWEQFMLVYDKLFFESLLVLSAGHAVNTVLPAYIGDGLKIGISGKKAYLELNHGVTVVKDNSSGSNASTVKVLKQNKMYFRKYAFDAASEKLAKQVDWIKTNQENIPLPIITSYKFGADFFIYDMPCYNAAVGLFDYIHTMPIENSWDILSRALEDIRVNLHGLNARKPDKANIEKYIAEKVQNNLRIITGDKYINKLEEYDQIYVNGIELNTLSKYIDMLDPYHLEKVFCNDTYANIHGDLTIENIICLKDNRELDREQYLGKKLPDDYYFIDPNTGNIHESPLLDYGKLLQSLHGGYEFLMMVSSVSVHDNCVDFLMTKSESYGLIYNRYKEWLKTNFTKEQVRSIYYHEIIHWLRLMPYKIRKNEKLAVVFYCELLTVLADVRKMENEEK